jgi:hypothetical protein
MQIKTSEEKSDWKFSEGLLDQTLSQQTTYQPINVNPFMDTLSTQTLTTLERQNMERDYSTHLRRTLKLTEYSRKSRPDLDGNTWLAFYPTCPICRKSLGTGGVEMHEALVTRGDVQGLSFDKQIQIYCPQNITLLHPHCHKKAQWHERGKRIVCRDILRWNGEQAVKDFLSYMWNECGSSAALESERMMSVWRLL